MLAFVFWHRPKASVDRGEYEAAQAEFHRALGIGSACFRLDALPFDHGDGYEDWYLVEDWTGLGRLNEAAVDAGRRGDHDHAAAMSDQGWGAVYALQRGAAEIPAGVEWRAKPRGEPTAELIEGLDAAAVWRRQLVLGPAPELCLARAASSGREAVWS